MKRVWIIFQKEVLDNLRDRRTIFSTILNTLFTPALLLALIIVLGRTINVDPEEKPLRLPVSGAEYAPALVAYLEQNNVEVVPAPEDPRSAVREGLEDVVLIIAPEYPDAFRAGKPAPVKLILDSSRQSASAAMQRARSLLSGYSSMLGILRLQARGVDPRITSAVSIGVQDVSTPQTQALIFLNMMPFLLTINVFFGGMAVIIDATAGERERGSLEPLLINPARRWEFVIGKLAASLPYAFFTLALVMLLFWLGFRIIPVEEYIGFPMVLSGNALFLIFLLLIPEVLLASGMQMLVAAFTRSFKEAQTYLSFLPIVIGLPGIFLTFAPVRSNLINMVVPTYGQSILINQILRGEQIESKYWMIATAVTLAAAVIVVYIAIRLYERERILFSK